MTLQVGVKAILKNPEGRFLLLKRNPNHVGLDHWDIPGGRIQPGSDLIKNLKREITEETNLLLSTEPTLIHAQDILKEDKHVVRLTYTAESNNDVTLNEEHLDFKWLFLEEVAKLDNLDPYAREAFSKYAKHFFPKLVRDKMPEIFKQKYAVETENEVVSDDREFLKALQRKIIEESTEVGRAESKEDLKKELADVFEIIDTILTLLNWSKEEIEIIQTEKRIQKGGFSERRLMKIPI